MLIKKIINKLFLLLMIFLFNTGMSTAETIIVDHTGTGDYLTIKEAVAAADSGDSVYVMPGTYYEQGILIQKDITLQGSGFENCIIDGGEPNFDWPNNTVIMVDSVNECKISGFFITNKGMGIHIVNSKSLIEDTIIDSCSTGIFCQYSSEINMINNQILNCISNAIGILDTSKIFLLSNIIANTKFAGIEVVRHSHAEIINNIIYYNGWHSLRVVRSSKAIVYNTIIWDNLVGIADDTDSDSVIINYSNIQPDLYGNVWEGIGNISTDPLYENTKFLDFRLKDNSPCIDTGHPRAVQFSVKVRIISSIFKNLFL